MIVVEISVIKLDVPLHCGTVSGNLPQIQMKGFVVAMESMVARAMAFLCSSGAYTTLLNSKSPQEGRRQILALAESERMIHSAIISLFCLAC
jgi:hypothetical protein